MPNEDSFNIKINYQATGVNGLESAMNMLKATQALGNIDVKFNFGNLGDFAKVEQQISRLEGLMKSAFSNTDLSKARQEIDQVSSSLNTMVASVDRIKSSFGSLGSSNLAPGLSRGIKEIVEDLRQLGAAQAAASKEIQHFQNLATSGNQYEKSNANRQLKILGYEQGQRSDSIGRHQQELQAAKTETRNLQDQIANERSIAAQERATLRARMEAYEAYNVAGAGPTQDINTRAALREKADRDYERRMQQQAEDRRLERIRNRDAFQNFGSNQEQYSLASPGTPGLALGLRSEAYEARVAPLRRAEAIRQANEVISAHESQRQAAGFEQINTGTLADRDLVRFLSQDFGQRQRAVDALRHKELLESTFNSQSAVSQQSGFVPFDSVSFNAARARAGNASVQSSLQEIAERQAGAGFVNLDPTAFAASKSRIQDDIRQNIEQNIKSQRLSRAENFGFNSLVSTSGIKSPEELVRRIKLQKEAQQRFLEKAEQALQGGQSEEEISALYNKAETLREAAVRSSAQLSQLQSSAHANRIHLEPGDVRRAKAQRALLFATPEEREDLEGFKTTLEQRFNLGQINPKTGKAFSEELRTPKFLEAGRLANPETAVQLGFAAAFGGIPSVIGGVLGGITPFGPSGALLGSTLAQAGGELLLKRPLEILKDVGEQFKESGTAFQRSILGITAIKQATEDTFLPGGATPGISQRGQILDFQQGQARKLQLEARSKLLPLGIGGETEATFVQGVVTALAQRGVNATSSQTARISELIGGAISAQRPSLLDNTQQLLKDLQDVIGGGPTARRTVLGQILRPVLPELQKATTAEEIEKALAPLAAFSEVAKRLDNPVVVQNRLQGGFENLKVAGGEALFARLTPALQKLFEAISTPKALEAAGKLGDAIGYFGAKMVDIQTALVPAGEALTDKFVPALKELPTVLGEAIVAIAAFGVASKLLSFGLGGPIAGLASAGGVINTATGAISKAGLFAGLGGLLGRAGAGLGAVLGGPIVAPALAGIGLVSTGLAAGQFFGDLVANRDIEKTEELSKLETQLSLQRRKFTSVSKISNQIDASLQKIGLKDKFEKDEESASESPQIQLAALRGFRAEFEDSARKEGGPTLEKFLARSFTALGSEGELQAKIRQENLKEKYNQYTPYGQLEASQAEFDTGLTEDLPTASLRLKAAEDQLKALNSRSPEELKLAQEAQKAAVTGAQAEKTKAEEDFAANQTLLSKFSGREEEAKRAVEFNKTHGGPFGLYKAAVPSLSKDEQIDQATAKLAQKPLQDALESKNKIFESLSKDLTKIGTPDEKAVTVVKGEIDKAGKEVAEIQHKYFKDFSSVIEGLRSNLAKELAVIETGSSVGQEFSARAKREELFVERINISKLPEKSDAERKTKQLAQAENAAKEFEAQRELRQSSISSIREKGLGIDTFDLGGKQRAADIESQALNAEFKTLPADISSLEYEADEANRSGNIKLRIAKLSEAAKLKNRLAEGSKLFSEDFRRQNLELPEERIQARTGADKAGFEVLSVTQKLRDRFSELTDAVTGATRSLEDYTHQQDLRALGHTGNRIAAAEALIKAGGSTSEIAPDIQSYLEPGGRERFELENARAKLSEVERTEGSGSGFRLIDEETEGRKVKERGERTAERNLGEGTYDNTQERLSTANNFLKNYDSLRKIPGFAGSDKGKEYATRAEEAFKLISIATGQEGLGDVDKLRTYYGLDPKFAKPSDIDKKADQDKGNPSGSGAGAGDGTTGGGKDVADGKKKASADGDKQDTVIALLTDIKKNLSNPTGFGSQMKAALNDAFA